ncbi:MAG: hypothetical protein ACIALR_08910 [Blastopirellula sp. JB062]
MKFFSRRSALLAILIASVVTMGCKQDATPAPKSDSDASGDADHGHDHGPGGHDHGDEAGHGGHAPGPHGGTLADWGGGKYHVEFTVDHENQKATVYILGDDEKTPTPITIESVLLTIKDPKLQIDLLPSPQPSDPAGQSSRFVGTHDGLGTVKEYEGTISAAIDGTPYAGSFLEEAHGEGHSHSHGGDDALVWIGEPKKHAGMVIKLGHHGQHLHKGEEVEPAVEITQNGKPVADAKVFNALVTQDGGAVLAKEVGTIYEPATPQEPAHYAQGGLKIPTDAQSVAIRFRIVPPGGEPVTYETPISVE